MCLCPTYNINAAVSGYIFIDHELLLDRNPLQNANRTRYNELPAEKYGDHPEKENTRAVFEHEKTVN